MSLVTESNSVLGDAVECMRLSRTHWAGIVGGWNNMEWSLWDMVEDEGFQTESNDPAERWEPLHQNEWHLIDGVVLQREIDAIMNRRHPRRKKPVRKEQ